MPQWPPANQRQPPQPGHLPWRHLALALAVALALGGWFGWRQGTVPTTATGDQAMAQALVGKVIVIDPGHGGPDSGAVGVAGTREKDVVLAVSLRLRDLLVSAGARPILTRETDKDLRDQAVLTEPKRRWQELAARVRVAEVNRADVFLSIHANKFRRNSPWKGAQVFYDPRGRLEGERLARVLQEALREQTHTTRTHRPIQQFVLQRSPVPAANVELGFLSNTQEEQMLRDPEYQQKLAYTILLGLARYFSGS